MLLNMLLLAITCSLILPCTHGVLDANFMDTVSTIYLHAYGTEHMAPYLYSLVRFHRPTHIVEFGGGYTTPFLAKALEENRQDAILEPANHPVPLMLHREFYEQGGSLDPVLTVIDDGSQNNKDFEAVMDQLDIQDVDIQFKHGAKHSDAPNVPDDSVGLIWNDAQWDPDYLKHWWPKLKRDGGLMLLHNVIGNGADGDRWAVGSPRRALKQVFPHEKFEFLTLIEPNKRYQGSVAMLRRLAPEKRPTFYSFLWGMSKKERKKVEQIQQVQSVVVGSSESQEEHAKWRQRAMHEAMGSGGGGSQKLNTQKKQEKKKKKKKKKRKKKKKNSWRDDLEL